MAPLHHRHEGQDEGADERGRDPEKKTALAAGGRLTAGQDVVPLELGGLGPFLRVADEPGLSGGQAAAGQEITPVLGILLPLEGPLSPERVFSGGVDIGVYCRDQQRQRGFESVSPVGIIEDAAGGNELDGLDLPGQRGGRRGEEMDRDDAFVQAGCVFHFVAALIRTGTRRTDEEEEAVGVLDCFIQVFLPFRARRDIGFVDPDGSSGIAHRVLETNSESAV